MMHLKLHYTHFLTQIGYIAGLSVSNETLRGWAGAFAIRPRSDRIAVGGGWIPVLT
jgi:hypothetical protein